MCPTGVIPCATSWDGFGRKGPGRCRTGAQRRLKKCTFDLFLTLQHRPKHWGQQMRHQDGNKALKRCCPGAGLSPGPCQGQGSLQALALLQQSPSLLSLAPRNDPLTASEMLLPVETQKRFRGQISRQGGCALSWSPSVPRLLSQRCSSRQGITRQSPPANTASAGRAWSFLRATCQPSSPNPGGKKTPLAVVI